MAKRILALAGFLVLVSGCSVDPDTYKTNDPHFGRSEGYGWYMDPDYTMQLLANWSETGTKIDSSGNLTVAGTTSLSGHLTTYAYDDAQILLSAATVPAAGGPDLGAFPAGQATEVYLFDANSDECVDGSLQLSHKYREGTDLSCHIHWAPITTSTNSVVWQMDYTITNPNGTFGNPTQVFVQDAGDGTANKHQIVDFADIDCSACGISAILLAHVCRDANGTNGTDNMAGDVAGISLDCHYQVDGVGSSEEYAK